MRSPVSETSGPVPRLRHLGLAVVLIAALGLEAGCGGASPPGAGAPTAANIGPSVRFIGGTHNVSRLLAKTLASRARARQ